MARYQLFLTKLPARIPAGTQSLRVPSALDAGILNKACEQNRLPEVAIAVSDTRSRVEAARRYIEQIGGEAYVYDDSDLMQRIGSLLAKVVPAALRERWERESEQKERAQPGKVQSLAELPINWRTVGAVAGMVSLLGVAWLIWNAKTALEELPDSQPGAGVRPSASDSAPSAASAGTAAVASTATTRNAAEQTEATADSARPAATGDEAESALPGFFRLVGAVAAAAAARVRAMTLSEGIVLSALLLGLVTPSLIRLALRSLRASEGQGWLVRAVVIWPLLGAGYAIHRGLEVAEKRNAAAHAGLPTKPPALSAPTAAKPARSRGRSPAQLAKLLGLPRDYVPPRTPPPGASAGGELATAALAARPQDGRPMRSRPFVGLIAELRRRRAERRAAPPNERAAAADQAPAEQAQAEQSAAKQAPAEQAAAKQAPAKQAPAEQAPAEQASAADAVPARAEPSQARSDSVPQNSAPRTAARDEPSAGPDTRSAAPAAAQEPAAPADDGAGAPQPPALARRKPKSMQRTALEAYGFGLGMALALLAVRGFKNMRRELAQMRRR